MRCPLVLSPESVYRLTRDPDKPKRATQGFTWGGVLVALQQQTESRAVYSLQNQNIGLNNSTSPCFWGFHRHLHTLWNKGWNPWGSLPFGHEPSGAVLGSGTLPVSFTPFSFSSLAELPHIFSIALDFLLQHNRMSFTQPTSCEKAVIHVL